MNANPSVAPPAPAPGSQRIASIDALRGFDMFWIAGGWPVVVALLSLFVDPVPGWLKTQMNHVGWEGFSALDLVHPLFLFIVGTAMPFSFAKRIEAGQSTPAIYRKVLIRVAVLWILGMAAQGNLLQANLSQLRLYSNTLQSIAAGYLIASIALLHLRVWGQVLLTVALLVGYWLLMLLVPIPGHDAGVLEPKLNLALYIDEQILGRFRDGSEYTWILSSMNFASTVLLGVLSGHVLRVGMAPWKKVGLLVAIGALCLGIGWAWSMDWMGSLRFPIIKHIYTSSMVLWACGLSYLLLALFYLVIDVLGFRRWAFFFVVIGANAIFAYMATELFQFRKIGDIFVGGIARNLMASQYGLLHQIGGALSPVAAFAVLWLILWYLYRNRTFIRI